MDEPGPRHFTKEPWWVVPLAGGIAALLPLVKYGQFRRAELGIGLVETMLTLGLLGVVASALLVVRSRIRSSVWSNVVLWLGIVIIAIGVCFVSIAMSS